MCIIRKGLPSGRVGTSKQPARIEKSTAPLLKTVKSRTDGESLATERSSMVENNYQPSKRGFPIICSSEFHENNQPITSGGEQMSGCLVSDPSFFLCPFTYSLSSSSFVAFISSRIIYGSKWNFSGMSFTLNSRQTFSRSCPFSCCVLSEICRSGVARVLFLFPPCDINPCPSVHLPLI